MVAATIKTARFVTGSTMRHVVVLASTGAIGMVAVFGVDLLNLFYISLLGQREIAAAIGFSGTVTFLQTSLAIGMTIGVGAVVSREIGAGDIEDARRVASASLFLMVVVLAVVGLLTVAFLEPFLRLLGADAELRLLSSEYLSITSLSLPLLAIGMGCSSLLRCVGDARRAMNVTLAGAVVTAAVDPLLILILHLDLRGAAISTVCSRLVIAGMGWWGAQGRYGMLGALHPRSVLRDANAVLAVAGPAVLTNLATPIGAAYVTRSMAAFGPAAIAGQATIDRITPVAFGLVYALSGAVGPIISQNLGAGQIERVREALRDSLLFVVVAVFGAWLLLALGREAIVVAFSVTGVTADLVRLFCTLLAGTFLFTGALYVANAAFNNLSFPLLSTTFNWGRATLGTIPFVTWGSAYGPQGVLVGAACGSIVFGVAAALVAFRCVGRLDSVSAREHTQPVPVPNASSGNAALASFAARPQQEAPP